MLQSKVFRKKLLASKNKRLLVVIALFNLQVVILPSLLMAQPNADNDSSYFLKYPGSITTRFYVSQKYTDFNIQGNDGAKDIKYLPNTTLNMGIGATYQNFSLNLAYGFGFINNDDDKGKTKYLDLQSHAYPGKWSFDLLGQFYKGYHLGKDVLSTSDKGYYYRPDIKVNLLGLSAYRVLNHTRFSYNAAFLQNEWQKKSAGSLLFGAEMYYGNIRGDSALVPSSSANQYPQAGINRLQFFSFGPGVGYAYQLVVKQHFFIMGSATVNLNLGFSTESTATDKRKKTAVAPETFFRFAAGYNSSTWSLSANWVGNRLPSRGAASVKNYLLHTGNYRIILAKKLYPGEKTKKLLKPVDKILNFL